MDFVGSAGAFLVSLLAFAIFFLAVLVGLFIAKAKKSSKSSIVWIFIIFSLLYAGLLYYGYSNSDSVLNFFVRGF